MRNWTTRARVRKLVTGSEDIRLRDYFRSRQRGDGRLPQGGTDIFAQSLQDSGHGTVEPANTGDANSQGVSNFSLRVACLGGTTLDVTLPGRGLVREVKHIVGQVRRVT